MARGRKGGGSIADLRAALAAIPDDPVALQELGLALYRNGDLKESEAATRRAIERTREPKLRAAALYNLGLLLEDRGDLAGALDAYRRSQQDRPHTAVAARLRDAPRDVPADVRFRDWVSAFASRRKLSVQEWWSANLDDDAPLERVALLCSKEDEPNIARYIVEDEAPRRWLLTKDEQDSKGPRCDRGGWTPGIWRRAAEQSIDLSRWQHDEYDGLQIAIRGGEPVVVAEAIEFYRRDEGDPIKKEDGSLHLDWTDLMRRDSCWYARGGAIGRSTRPWCPEMEPGWTSGSSPHRRWD